MFPLTQEERKEQITLTTFVASRGLCWRRTSLGACPGEDRLPDSLHNSCRGPLTEAEREERRLRKELEKAEKLLSRHQARESKENVKQVEKEERDKVREVARRNASRMAMEDLQVSPT